MVPALLAVMLSVGCTAQSVAPPVNRVTSTPAVSTAPATVVPPSATPTPTAATTEAKPFTLSVDSVLNFRDVAGDGLRLADGGRMARGVVFRSGKLATASASDRKVLSRAGFSDIIDLRTDSVAARTPDPKIPGVRRHLVNIFAVRATPTLTHSSETAARRYMRKVYLAFVRDEAQRSRIAAALELVAGADGRVIVHCTEGKDRTGWISALLQLVAGADREDVVSEYLVSNDYRADLIAAEYRKTLASEGVTAARIQRALLKVDASYLNAGLAAMDATYGGLDGYLTDGLGLSPKTVTVLRERLVA